ncbi:hypothetical protein FB451DRAFT_1404456 [Mycena latifolia]|nr:hypothetical protein FB451DRAFT_1404456 [Mycena latifolia]
MNFSALVTAILSLAALAAASPAPTAPVVVRARLINTTPSLTPPRPPLQLHLRFGASRASCMRAPIVPRFTPRVRRPHAARLRSHRRSGRERVLSAPLAYARRSARMKCAFR